MKNNNSDIDNLFAKLNTHSSNTNDSFDWELLQPKLRRQNFMRFGVRHFNIYYSAAIAIAIVSVLLVFVQPFNAASNSQPHGTTVTQTLPQKTPHSTQSDTTSKNVHTATAQQQQTPQTSKANTPQLKSEKPILIPLAQTPTTAQPDTTPQAIATTAPLAKPDSVAQSNTPTQLNPATPSTPKKAARKVVYQTLTDTIIAVDTIKQEKRKRRGLFSK